MGARLQCSLTLTTTHEHPLWTSHVWSGARALADTLCQQPELVAGRRVCELGAGTGLGSIVAALAGAAQVVATDYPDPEIIQNLERNIRRNTGIASNTEGVSPALVQVIPYRWGSSVAPLYECPRGAPFDVILMADLLSYHQAHASLLWSVKALLASPAVVPEAVALVTFAHHRPHVADRDLAFFDLVKTDGSLTAERWLPPLQMEPMFPQDAGAAVIRGRVHRWCLRWCRPATSEIPSRLNDHH